jgi:pimeloyl-ACP methyl ester carboxylesterase
MTEFFSHFVDVDGVRTHYLDEGDGPVVVLLHSGEFGGASEISWEYNISALAKHFRVIAPDWLGFGRTDKLYDFANSRARVWGHMRRFFEIMEIGSADFVGNSMGGSNLARIAADPPVIFPIRSVVLANGGGFAPETEERKTLLSYDGTPEAMSALLKAMMHDPKWGDNAAYVARRQEMAQMPGAWQCAAAARFKSPAATANSTGFGAPDATPYENIAFPTMIIAGAEDRLRERGYASDLASRIPDCELHVLENCGHCPNIEMADIFNGLVIAFLKRIHASA